ncbi:uncharacterized protein LY89DRAFT_667481 [Mollisia scopiformis]|uniref:Uncharacterized protein n=1 Tax=Mollisia scopiformis TaxID=149040 RepID=A0A194XH56_MOLSC|nr:uncharacterized protein LY89DRAFT_667481 [Mollisia scopiformis]KUJ19540.1 hypothetical protein LY89DRAFT_667481 [Mollisia scopiformis]
MAVTVALLYINFSEIYWEEVGTSNQSLRLNALQFAAKLHEILIAASLSMVAISYVQYEVLRGGGLPVGSVLAGFQITNLNSVFNLQLWRKLFPKGFQAHRLRFIAIVLVLVVMCAISGPSSAILILPSTGQWNIPMSLETLMMPYFGQLSESSRYRLFINATEARLWPSEITSESFLPSDCLFINSTTPQHCPAAGLTSLAASIEYLYYDDQNGLDVYDPSPRRTWNFTMPGETNDKIQLNTTHRFLAGAIADANILLSLRNSSEDLASVWIQPPDFGTFTTSIAAAFVMRESTYPMQLACSIYSSWQPEDIYVNSKEDLHYLSPSIDNYVVSLAVPEDNCSPEELSKDLASRHIRLDIDWINKALPNNETINQLIRSIKPIPNESIEPIVDVGTSLSLLITDALARFGVDINLTLAMDSYLHDPNQDAFFFESYSMVLENISEVDLVNSIEVFPIASHYGYSYSAEGVTRRIAVGILLVHIFIALVHTVLVLWHGWSYPDLETIYDIVILAIGSSTSTIGSESSSTVGVAELKKENFTFKVQEVSCSRLELVVKSLVVEASTKEERPDQNGQDNESAIAVIDRNSFYLWQHRRNARKTQILLQELHYDMTSYLREKIMKIMYKKEIVVQSSVHPNGPTALRQKKNHSHRSYSPKGSLSLFFTSSGNSWYSGRSGRGILYHIPPSALFKQKQ